MDKVKLEDEIFGLEVEINTLYVHLLKRQRESVDYRINDLNKIREMKKRYQETAGVEFDFPLLD